MVRTAPELCSHQTSYGSRKSTRFSRRYLPTWIGAGNRHAGSVVIIMGLDELETHTHTHSAQYSADRHCRSVVIIMGLDELETHTHTQHNTLLTDTAGLMSSSWDLMN